MRNITLNTATLRTPRFQPRTTALNFQPLTMADIRTVRKLLPMSHSRANDFTVGGMFMWSDYFDYQYCIYGNTLFIKGVSEKNPRVPAFSLPVGAMPLSCAVDLLKDYCRFNRTPLRFSAIPDDRLDELRAIAPGTLERLDDWSDYIYDAMALSTLSGKHLNKKRNHVNRFELENPGWKVEPLSHANIGQVRLAYTAWLERQPFEMASATEESVQTLNVLDNFSLFPFEGLVLRGRTGCIVAFTIGEVIGDTLFTHIEKMDHEVTGAGEMINREFARYITSRYPDVRYINREEDAGDPGLRQAKLSYHPSIILHKYDIVM